MIRLLLADDHTVVLAGLRALFGVEKDLEVVGEVHDGARVVAEVERLKPDVLVLDLVMPGLGGLEVARQVRQVAPRTRVLVLSMHGAEAYAAESLRSGAAGYVLKAAPARELVSAIRAVDAGRRYLSAPLSEQLIADFERRRGATHVDPLATLTAREREVFELAAEGLKNREIAARLEISRRTVESHRANVMSKLGLRSHVELVRYAIQRGLLPQ